MVSERTITETRWRGIAASPGVALGPAFVYRVDQEEPPPRILLGGIDVDREFERFGAALKEVEHDLQAVRMKAPKAVGSALAKIFDAQLLLVQDTSIRADVEKLITEKRITAERAFSRVVGRAQESIASSNDPYLREMDSEVAAVKRRVINRLLGVSDSPQDTLTEPAVLLAHTITPSDIMSLRQDRILGVVSETGGQTSHTALLAKSLGIPAVVGIRRDVRMVRPGTRVVINGYSGIVILEPSPGTVEFMERKKRRAQFAWPKRLDAIRELKATTTDGHTIDLMANIDLAGEANLAVAAGADGIGLYRTEYLFLQRGGYPSEARQRAIYRRAISELGGRTLVVRTFDLGSDKVAPDSPVESNPALGVRGLRLSLLRPKTLASQFQALLAASVDGPVKIMVPMVSALEEFLAVKAEWRKAQRELSRKKVPFDATIPLGLMIETPAAVYIAAELADEADFLSIGTNDLIQYTAAVDRGNSRLGHLGNYWHPALWRQIAAVVRAARPHDTPVTVCGEMASDPLCIPALVGLGLAGVSVQPNSIPKIKSLIRSIAYTEASRVAEQTLRLKTATAIQKALKDFNRRVLSRDTRTSHG